MRHIFAIVALVICLAACSRTDREFYQSWEADIQFDSVDIETTEQLMRDVSEEWGLTYFEKDRSQMAFLNKGEPSFYMMLFDGDHGILDLTNAVVSHQLRLDLIDLGEMPAHDLERLAAEVRKKLESRFDIEFRHVPTNDGSLTKETKDGAPTSRK